MSNSLNTKVKEQFDHDDSGGSLNTNQSDFLESESASGNSINTQWRDWSSGTGVSLNNRLMNKHGGSGSFNTRWKNWVAFSSTHSFNFDGSNDYLIVENNSGLGFADGQAFSVSLWFNTTASGNMYLLDNRGGGSTTEGFAVVLDASGTNYLGYIADGANAATVTNTVNYNDGNWHHFAFTWDGTDTITSYIDGSSVGTNTQALGEVDGGDLYIGKYSANNSNYFNGNIDEVAVWNAELSASDVTSIYNNGNVTDLSKSASYGTDRTDNLKLWLRCGDKAEPESNTAIARQDFYTDFDGVNDYVDIDSTGISLNDFSISGWFYHIDSTAEFQAIIGLVNTGNDYQEGVVIQFYDDYLDAEGASVDGHLPKVSANTVGSGILQNSWNHFTYTVDKDGGSGGVKLYVNGALATTDTAVDSATNANNIYIGAGYYSSAVQRFYKGYISNIAIHQTALDAQTIKQFAKSRFTPMRDNRFSVVDFDGSNDYIQLPVPLSYTNHSISVWVNHSGTFKTIFASEDSGSDGIRLFTDDGSRLQYEINGSTAVASTAYTNQWVHYFCTYDGSTMRVYINGVQAQTTSASETVSTTTNARIGVNTAELSQYLSGSISSFAFYSTTKSAEEVYAIYQQGITYDESSLSGLVGYWRMGDDTSKAYPTIADSSSNSNDGTITNGASNDIVQQMVAGYDLGAFESSSEELGAELLTNGTFDTDSDWTKGDGWTIANGVASSDETAQSTHSYLTQSVSFKSGVLYKVSYDIVYNDSAGNGFLVQFLGSGSPQGTGRTSSGSFVDYIKATANHTSFNIRSSDGTATGTVDNISLREVLQSAVSDTHPAIIDVNEPVLGAELFTNGWTNDGNGSSYPPYSGSFSYDASANTVTATSGSSGTFVGNETFRTEFTAVANAFYKITFTSSNTHSGIQIRGLSSANHLDTQTSTPYLSQNSLGDANHVFYVRANASATRYVGFRSFGANRSITVSNFSIKQVFGNVGLMTNQATSDLVYSSVLPDQSFLTGVNSAYNFVSLDGSNDYIKNESFTGHQQDTGTISIWVKFGDISGFQYITGVGGNTSTGTNRVITLSDENLRFSGYSADFDTGADVVADNWYHIVLIWNGTSVTFYLDGTAYTNTVSNLVTPTGTNFVVGAYPAGFGGKAHADFGTVAHWNKVLTSTEVNAIKTLGRHGNLLDSYSDNLKLCYSMSGLDAKTGFADTATTIYDRSGNSNHGTTVSIASSDLKSSPNAQPEGYAKGDTNRSTTTP